MPLGFADWKNEAATARQIVDTLQGRVATRLASIEAGLFASPFDYLTIPAPDTDDAYWQIARQEERLPAEAFHTPSIGVVIGDTENLGIGDAQGAWEMATTYHLLVVLSEADHGTRDPGDMAQVGSAYVSAVWQVLSASLKEDANNTSATSESLGYGLPVLTVIPVNTAPAEPFNTDFDPETGAAVGSWFYVGEVTIQVTQYHAMV